MDWRISSPTCMPRMKGHLWKRLKRERTLSKVRRIGGHSVFVGLDFWDERHLDAVRVERARIDDDRVDAQVSAIRAVEDDSQRRVFSAEPCRAQVVPSVAVAIGAERFFMDLV